jgi:diguanylate cyclase (GGDEF)-like protein
MKIRALYSSAELDLSVANGSCPQFGHTCICDDTDPDHTPLRRHFGAEPSAILKPQGGPLPVWLTPAVHSNLRITPAEPDQPTAQRSDYALIAEPDARRAAIYRDFLESAGLETVVTRNGDEAKALLRRRELPALVVANLSLPRLDGFALLAEIRRAGGAEGPPVVVISSSKELSGAAWNLKERLGVTELVPGDASKDQIAEALVRVLPGLAERLPISPDGVQAALLHGRWIGEALDRVGADVAHRFGVAIVMISVNVGDEEWCRVHINLPRRPLSGRISPRSWSYVRQVVEGHEPIVVPDVMQHPVFSKNLFPPAGTLRGYVGVPIISANDRIDGALCLFDSQPLSLDARALDALQETAGRVAIELDSALERVRTQEKFTELSRLALTDKVTGLANRRGGEEALAREVSRARRTGSPLSLALFDIDRFKTINDQAGHAAGDRVLRALSDILSASQRGSDLAMRWGGEEFLVLLPDVGLVGARSFAERVRDNIQNMSVPGTSPITVSAGVSELQGDEDPAVTLARADANLYRAKAGGRNRVESDHVPAI